MTQVSQSHYSSLSYAHLGRWASYYYQIREVFNAGTESLLEIGVGDKVLGEYLKNNTTIKYTSLDYAEDLHPDVVGDIQSLPFEDNSYDVVCAFEVLEHLPFESFEQSISEMKRVAKKTVLISVPHFGPPVKFLLKVPFFPEIKFAFKIPFHKTHEWNGQHYWEVGKKGYSPSVLRSILKTHFKDVKEFVPFENQYHHFYTLTK